VAKISQTGPRNKADVAGPYHYNSHLVDPRPIAGSTSAARTALARAYTTDFLRMSNNEEPCDRHDPLGPRSGAEFACRGRATPELLPAAKLGD
jgi:hypothetical protein